jgi:hypothetical protein
MVSWAIFFPMKGITQRVDSWSTTQKEGRRTKGKKREPREGILGEPVPG